MRLIEDSELSQRAKNALLGIKTLEECTNFTAKELLKRRALGKVSLREIREYLADCGLYFKDENPKADEIEREFEVPFSRWHRTRIFHLEQRVAGLERRLDQIAKAAT